MNRYRIGLAPNIKSKGVEKMGRCSLIVVSEKAKDKKYGFAVVGHMDDNVGHFFLPQIRGHVIFGNDHDMLVKWVKETGHRFVLIVVDKEMGATAKKAIKELDAKTTVKVSVIGKSCTAVDLMLNKQFRDVSDLDMPLYESTAPRVAAKVTSAPNPSKTAAKVEKPKQAKKAEAPKEDKVDDQG